MNTSAPHKQEQALSADNALNPRNGAWPLPELAADMAARLGFSDALRVVERLGGLTLRIGARHCAPDKAPRAPLAQCLGAELESALHRHYYGEILYIPRCTALLAQKRNLAIHAEFERLLQSGKSARAIVAELARSFALSDRHIWHILKLPLSAANESHAHQQRLF